MMDELGISAQIVFPNVVGFGGQNFFRITDLELRKIIVQIWNDAMVDMQMRVRRAAVRDGAPAVVGHRRDGRARFAGEATSGSRA